MGYLEELEAALTRLKNWRPSDHDGVAAQGWIDWLDKVWQQNNHSTEAPCLTLNTTLDCDSRERKP